MNSIEPPAGRNRLGGSSVRARSGPERSSSGQPGRPMSTGGAGLCKSFRQPNRFAVLSEEGCACCPLV
eukprot:807151-Alexandrium_andersonii.AAC.1